MLGRLAASDRLPVRASPEDKAAKVATAQPAEDKLDRTVLPIKEPLLKLEGYSNEEIARSLDCSLSTVEQKLDVIRKRWTAEGTP